jgi:hypothetical protein
MRYNILRGSFSNAASNRIPLSGNDYAFPDLRMVAELDLSFTFVLHHDLSPLDCP